jgi:hypothetical protein
MTTSSLKNNDAVDSTEVAEATTPMAIPKIAVVFL